MAGPEDVKIVEQGRDAIDAWRKANATGVLDLRKANRNGMDLHGAKLSGAVTCL